MALIFFLIIQFQRPEEAKVSQKHLLHMFFTLGSRPQDKKTHPLGLNTQVREFPDGLQEFTPNIMHVSNDSFREKKKKDQKYNLDTEILRQRLLRIPHLPASGLRLGVT